MNFSIILSYIWTRCNRHSVKNAERYSDQSRISNKQHTKYSICSASTTYIMVMNVWNDSRICIYYMMHNVHCMHNTCVIWFAILPFGCHLYLKLLYYNNKWQKASRERCPVDWISPMKYNCVNVWVLWCCVYMCVRSVTYRCIFW